MTAKNKVLLDDVTAYIVGLFPSLNAFEQRLSLELYRLLAKGQAVPRQRLAERLESTVETVNKTLDSWPGVFSNERRQIVGYWGLALPEAYPSPHTITVSDQSLSAWCAWDTLFLPQLLGQVAEIESNTPQDLRVYLRVTPERIEFTYPVDMQMSFLLPDTAAVQKDVLNAFCHFVHFFPSQEAGQSWVTQHPGTFLMSLEEGHDLARRKNRALYPDFCTDEHL